MKICLACSPGGHLAGMEVKGLTDLPDRLKDYPARPDNPAARDEE